MPKLRIGLIGSGKMGLQHLKVISGIPSAVVVGIADPAADHEALKPLLPSGAVVLADVDHLLDLRPDVVHIVTPPGTHAALAQRAIAAGCHVYVEKPFTPTAVEAETLLAAAAAARLQVCAGHQYLFERPFLLSLEARQSIGEIVHVESYFSFKTARRTITPVEQAKDILPHAVYPLVEQLRQASGKAEDDIEIKGIDVHAGGDVYALLRLGGVTGVLTVTLRGRPVEQFQHLVGTNGWIRADYITGSVTRLTGPGAGLGVLFTPYRRALQTLTGATSGFYRLIFRRKSSYPGLDTLVRRFYEGIQGTGPVALTPRSIVDTVSICERLGAELDEAESRAEAAARVWLQTAAERRPASRPGGRVLVTGATGLLGRRVAAELASAGFEVRSVSRRLPRYSERVAGVDYRSADLGVPLPLELLAGVTSVVHCAAETAGGQADQKKNSIAATEHVLMASASAGVTRVLHISSLAVLKPNPSIQVPLNEATPVDHGNLGRGPYVWGKAESEVSAVRAAPGLGIALKVIRPGPLVDFAEFNPPGRLGREVGPFFVAIGPAGAALSVCDVGTAASVIRHYLEDFDNAPPMLNLVEAPPPTRRELVGRLRAVRPDLRVVWFPAWLLRILSGPLKLAQRVALGSKQPIDVYSAFASHRYATDLAGAAIERAGRSRIEDLRPVDDVHANA